MQETNLARLRKQAGLSQAKLAAATDTNRFMIAKIEQSARDMGGVSLRVAAKWAAALGVHAEELLDGDAP